MLTLVKITFTSLKPPKINTTLTALPSQTFHAIKTRLAEETNLNISSLRLLLKNKAISDSKTVQEVFGETTEAQVTVMVMKSNTTTTTTTTTSSDGSDKMDVDNDVFWEGIRAVVNEKYAGQSDKEEVFAALKKGFHDKFGSA
jgi:hypothetical protein